MSVLKASDQLHRRPAHMCDGDGYRKGTADGVIGGYLLHDGHRPPLQLHRRTECDGYQGKAL